MAQLFANNASTILYANIDQFATTILLPPGHGQLFPLVSSGSGDYFYCTLESSNRSTREFVKVIKRTADALIVERGKDSSIPSSFLAGDYVELRVIKASFDALKVESIVSSSNPVMDGVATSGTSLLVSREDHAHPSDTSRAPVDNPVFTGLVTAPTIKLGNGSTISWQSGVGLQLNPVSGTTYDFALRNAANTNWVFWVTKNTNNVVYAGNLHSQGTISATALSGPLTGNASTATKLLSPKNINGVAFDGSANITVSLTNSLTTGDHLTLSGGFDGSANKTITIDATANLLSNTIVSRDSNGDFSARKVSAELIGNVIGNLSGTASTATVSQSCSGNSVTSTTAQQLSGDQSNWKSFRTKSVTNMLGWNNYGNGHVIFDASAGIAPDGSSISNHRAQVGWTPTYPVLMGWNGTNTYDVHVGHANFSDTATSLIGGLSTSYYSTVVNATNPMTEVNKPGAVAYGMYINGSNQLAIANTNGTGSIIGVDKFTLDGSGNANVYASLSAGSIVSRGTIYAAGDITAFSDARLKTDVETITDALNTVSQLRGVSYVKDGAKSIGVIAQEVKEVIPEVVHDNGEYMSVAYGNLVGVLIEAIKELKAEVEELKTKVM